MQLKWILVILGASIAIFLIGFLSFKLSQPEKSGIQVITGDKTATVFLNDHYLDRTPLIEKNLKPGTYTLKIEPEDESLASYETEITLYPDTLAVVTWHPEKTVDASGGVIYEMKKINSQKAVVNFVSIPDKAIIKIDDRPTDFTPLLLEDLEAGEHKYEISLPAYETQQNSLNVKNGYRVDAIIKLAKVSGNDSPTQASDSAQPKTNEASSSAQNASPSAHLKQVTILKTGLMQNGVEVLRIRQNPTQSSTQVGLAKVGQKYPYLDEKNGWYQIKFGENLEKVGWISAHYAEKDF